MTIMYALGWTQHSQGSQMIRTGAIVQLLLGNIGVPGGGMNALRGHSNIQGLTDLGLLSNSLPGYMSLARDSEQNLPDYYKTRALKALRPNQMSYWQNYPKFFVSMQKSWWGDAATAENEWAFHYLPKIDKLYDILQAFELMNQGKLNGYICQGFNPVGSFPDKKKIIDGLSKLKFLVTIDPLHHRDQRVLAQLRRVQRRQDHRHPDHGVPPAFDLLRGRRRLAHQLQPLAAVALEGRGAAGRSQGRHRDRGGHLQPHAPGLHQGRRRLPRSDRQADVALQDSAFALGARAGDGIQRARHHRPARPEGPDQAAAGQGRRTALGLRPACATTARRLRAAGSTQARGRRRATRWRGATTPTPTASAWCRTGRGPGRRTGASSTTAPRPTRPPARHGLPGATSSPGTARQWTGADVPDIRPDANPMEADAVRPFIMTAEGVARLFAPTGMAEGPLPEHYEPFESPLVNNLMHPNNPKARANPAARIFKGDLERLGVPKDFPYVATSYRLTEHFHYWTKNVRTSAIIQPQQFVEIGEELAKEKGIANGDMVKVWSKRGFIKAVALVTKRIVGLQVDGRTVHTVGLPNHWGFVGIAKPGYLVNTLTPFVGDANTQTPEYKSFTVNIEKA
jgi:formate dehydrogenase major subunit